MVKKVLKPKLIVIAGPNGSGKTTFTNQVLRHDWSEEQTHQLNILEAK
jgi:uridine kinase